MNTLLGLPDCNGNRVANHLHDGVSRIPGRVQSRSLHQNEAILATSRLTTALTTAWDQGPQARRELLRVPLLRHALLGLTQQLQMSLPPLQQRRLISESARRLLCRTRLLPTALVDTPQAKYDN